MSSRQVINLPHWSHDCAGGGGGREGSACQQPARWRVLTSSSRHNYCRDHLPRWCRPFVGLGTVPRGTQEVPRQVNKTRRRLTVAELEESFARV